MLTSTEEECPGPVDLESALLTETLDKVTTQPPLVVDAGATLAETISRMQQGARGCALVVGDAGRLAGIFTERDVLMRVAGHTIDYGQTAVRDFMTRDPVTLPSDSSVAFALNDTSTLTDQVQLNLTQNNLNSAGFVILFHSVEVGGQNRTVDAAETTFSIASGQTAIVVLQISAPGSALVGTPWDFTVNAFPGGGVPKATLPVHLTIT